MSRATSATRRRTRSWAAPRRSCATSSANGCSDCRAERAASIGGPAGQAFAAFGREPFGQASSACTIGEGLRRAGDRDVEQAQPGAVGGDERGRFDDHDVVELESLRLGRRRAPRPARRARRSRRSTAPTSRERRDDRRVQRGRRDHRERAGAARARRARARRSRRRARSGGVATKRGCSPVLRTDRDGSTVGRGDREQAGGDLHDLGRRPVVDRQGDERGPESCWGTCASTSAQEASAPGRLAWPGSPTSVIEPDGQRRASMRHCIAVRSCASSTSTCPNVRGSSTDS